MVITGKITYLFFVFTKILKIFNYRLVNMVTMVFDFVVLIDSY